MTMRMIMLFMKMKKLIGNDNDNVNGNDNDNDNFAYDNEKTNWTKVTRMAMVKGLGAIQEVQITEVNITETR